MFSVNPAVLIELLKGMYFYHLGVLGKQPPLLLWVAIN